MRLSIFAFFFVLVLSIMHGVQPAHAVVPASLNYQGHLTDNAGVPIDGPVDITFAIYDVASGGTALWSGAYTVDVDQGVFSIELGGASLPFPPGLFEMPLWLGLTVDSDAEMTPRRPLTSVGFAFKASDADSVEGVSAATLDQSAHVVDTANPHVVTATQTGAATAADIASHAALASAHHDKTTTFSELSGQIDDAQIPAAIARDSEIMSIVLGNDGAGSGLDADLLDGLSSSAFMSSAADNWVNITGDIMTGPLFMDLAGYSEVMNIDSSLSYSWLRWEENHITRGLIGYMDGNTFWGGGVETPGAFAIKGSTALHLGDDNLVMTIDNGAVGIGTTSPNYDLHVMGDIGNYVARFQNDTSSSTAYGIQVNANASATPSSGTYGGYFNSEGGSLGGTTYSIFSEAIAHGASNAYGIYSSAIFGTTTGREYAFYGVGESYISGDMDIGGTALIGYERIAGTPVALSFTVSSCAMINTGTCYYGSASVSCPTGKVALGGGCYCNSNHNCGLIQNFPGGSTHWNCRAVASAGSYYVTPYVHCARVGN